MVVGADVPGMPKKSINDMPNTTATTTNSALVACAAVVILPPDRRIASRTMPLYARPYSSVAGWGFLLPKRFGMVLFVLREGVHDA